MKENITWVTAQMAGKLTGLTQNDLRRLRRSNPPHKVKFYTVSDTGGYLYNFEKLKELKQAV